MTLASVVLASCAGPMVWPEAPIHSFGDMAPGAGYPDTRDEAMAAIEGRYAHYDVVAYEDNSTQTPMRTFIISYGFTEFFREGDRLLQRDSFVDARYKLNQSGVATSIDRRSVEAIAPRVQEVELFQREGLWQVYRPESPTLLGITGDPDQPLSQDPEDTNIIDPDGDGNPGVTVNITIAEFVRGEIYITRREIYRNHLMLHPDGRLVGHVEDLSEQFVIDANLRILRQPSNNVQVGGPGLNPIILVPVGDDVGQDLMERRDEFFPPEPEFPGKD